MITVGGYLFPPRVVVITMLTNGKEAQGAWV